MGTRVVGLLHFVAVRAFGECGGGQMVVCAALIFAPLGMTTFRIGHTYSSNKSRLVARAFYGVSAGIAIAS
jgi:hypothetical protein